MKRLLFVVAFLPACLHPPRDYKGSLEETSQQAIIFYENGREELILKVDYKAKGDKLPTSLAWVVPTPTTPDHYAVTSAKVFEELFRMTEELERGKGPSEGHSGIELLAKVTVGEYEIQPIKAKGPAAGDELNRWLKDSGYGEVPRENMQYYLDAGWTFLAIKILKDKAKESLEAEGGFRPLRISFAADRIYYPLKFSSHQGTFAATLYVVTPKPVDAAQAAKFGFTAGVSAEVDADSNPSSSFAELWGEIRKQDRVKFTKGTVQKFQAAEINGKKSPLSGWKEDFSIKVD